MIFRQRATVSRAHASQNNSLVSSPLIHGRHGRANYPEFGDFISSLLDDRTPGMTFVTEQRLSHRPQLLPSLLPPPPTSPLHSPLRLLSFLSSTDLSAVARG